LANSIDNDFIVVAKSESFAEGTLPYITYSIYIAPKGFPGKVLVLDFSSDDLYELSPSKYFEKMSIFSKIVESLQIYNY